MAKVILDTGPLIALLDRREKFHSWAQEQIKQLHRPLYTCEAVLTEAFFLLTGHPKPQDDLHALIRTGIIVPEFQFRTQGTRVLALMATYRSIPMSFADACLVSMVESTPDSTVFTLDRDFTIYRQHRRRLIPLIAPF